ncbi:MAG: trypsin-like peptidase domain-containing protein [Patescibacteria group bacterium]
MKLEELTKQQIILLTLLVSFVTSIATGIVTVTLLGQTPPGTTQTVNRILERTVEKIVPDKQGASVVTSEKTVVVKEEDLITKSIENGSKSIVRIYEKLDTSSKEENNKLGNFVGIGVVVSKDGRIISDGSFFDKQKNYVISTYDNRTFAIENKSNDGSNIFIGDITNAKDKENYIFNPVSFSDSKNLKLGQTVIAIGGEDRDSVTEGIVSSILRENITVKENTDKTKPEVTKTITSEIQTSIQPIKIVGVPLLNLFGEVIGLNVISKDEFIIIPSDYIIEQLGFVKLPDIKGPVKK